MDPAVFLAGFSTGLGLIVAIGAQNAFVLRQGLAGRHVFAVCAVCALSDALLIAVGVTSFAAIAEALPLFEPAMRLFGAAFLVLYGLRSLRSALRSTEALDAEGRAEGGLRAAVLTALALTFLNPHVYLDTVVLLGTIAAGFPGREVAFGAGAMTASLVFFFSLGYGARLLRPLFERPAAWRVLEAVIALVMFAIAAKLLLGG